jgi:hypothetical protein
MSFSDNTEAQAGSVAWCTGMLIGRPASDGGGGGGRLSSCRGDACNENEELLTSCHDGTRARCFNQQ